MARLPLLIVFPMMKLRNRIVVLLVLTAFSGVGFYLSGARHGEKTYERVDGAGKPRLDSSQQATMDGGNRSKGTRETDDLIEKFKSLSKSGLPYSDLRLRRKMLVLAIAEQLGYDAALSAIDHELGPGAEKSLLMASVFMGAREPVDISLARLAGLPVQERGFAIAGLLERIGHQKLAEVEIDKIVSSDELFEERKSLSMILTVSLSNDGSPRRAKEELQNWESRIKAAPLEHQQALLLSVVDGVSAVFPYEAWSFLSEEMLLVSGDSESQELGSAVEKIAARMFDSDPARSMAVFLEMGDHGVRFLNGNFRQWMKMGSKAASDWYAAVSGDLSGSQRDAFSSGFADYYSSSGDFGAAWSRQETIEDPIQKKKVEGVVWARERESLRREVNLRPELTIQAIASGDSTFGDYWLEEAVNTWVSNDFDAATKWYDENWNTFPKDKAQYVAAAFATQAIGTGDVEMAKQWSALIHDVKTKARIEAAIAKAAAGQ